MKKMFLVLTVLTGALVFNSCKQSNKQATVEEIELTSAVSEVVKDSITDANGNNLYLTFDNSKGTVDVVLNGDTATLLQDTTASGIKFADSNYEYVEWQGKITLKKDGNIVFENQK